MRNFDPIQYSNYSTIRRIAVYSIKKYITLIYSMLLCIVGLWLPVIFSNFNVDFVSFTF